MHSLRNVHTFYDPSTRIWAGLATPPIFNPDQSIGGLVLAVLERNRRKVLQISADSGVRLTGAELRLRTIRVAQNLTKIGYGGPVEDGTIFAMAVRNGEHTAPLMFGCLALGIPVNTLEPTFQREDLGHMLSKVKPVVVFCDCETLSEMLLACELAEIMPRIFVIGDRMDGFGHVDDLLLPTGDEDSFVATHIPNPSKKLAILICSSGTTGRSKAVCLSHSTCIAHVGNFFECHPDDVVFASSSLYWLTGLAMLLAGTMWGATRVITRETYSGPRQILDIIQRFRVSVVPLPPSYAWAIVNEPNISEKALASLRLPFCGGGLVSENLKQSFERLIPGRYLEIVYGMSEVGYATTFTRREGYKAGCVGYARAGIEFKIVGEDGCAVTNGEEGEVLMRSKYAFLGYYGNEASTEETLDGDGWLHSGDIGRFDEDGLLYIVDRKKDIIKYGGFQISPGEIENVIQDIPGVAVACVVGIPKEGHDLPTALVIRKANDGHFGLDSDRVVSEVKKRLPDYKHLRGGVRFVQKLPMTPSGKVIRKMARELALAV